MWTRCTVIRFMMLNCEVEMPQLFSFSIKVVSDPVFGSSPAKLTSLCTSKVSATGLCFMSFCVRHLRRCNLFKQLKFGWRCMVGDYELAVWFVCWITSELQLRCPLHAVVLNSFINTYIRMRSFFCICRLMFIVRFLVLKIMPLVFHQDVGMKYKKNN